jgi:hypothetical protein
MALLTASVVRVVGYRSRGRGSIPGVGLERGALSIVSAIEELLESHSDYTAPFYPQELALTSPTSDGRRVGKCCITCPSFAVEVRPVSEGLAGCNNSMRNSRSRRFVRVIEEPGGQVGAKRTDDGTTA